MNETVKKKKMGRPVGYKASKGMDYPMPKVMLTKEQLTTYKAASERTGQTFSAWVRSALDKAAKKG